MHAIPNYCCCRRCGHVNVIGFTQHVRSVHLHILFLTVSIEQKSIDNANQWQRRGIRYTGTNVFICSKVLFFVLVLYGKQKICPIHNFFIVEKRLFAIINLELCANYLSVGNVSNSYNLNGNQNILTTSIIIVNKTSYPDMI